MLKVIIILATIIYSVNSCYDKINGICSGNCGNNYKCTGIPPDCFCNKIIFDNTVIDNILKDLFLQDDDNDNQYYDDDDNQYYDDDDNINYLNNTIII
jgi:hypothetical protein